MSAVRTHSCSRCGEHLEQQVAGLVTVGVVDRLEPVEVDVEDRGPLAVAAGEVQVVLGAVEEEGAVGQLGERVVHRRVPELLLQLDDPAQVGSSRPRSREVATWRANVSSSARSLPANVPTSPRRPTDQQQALHPALGAQHRDHRVLERVPGGVALELRAAHGAGAGGERTRARSAHAIRASTSSRRSKHAQRERLLAVAVAAQRRRAVGFAEQHELGRLARRAPRTAPRKSVSAVGASSLL